MSRPFLLACVLALYCLCAAVCEAQTSQFTTTARDRHSINVTIYNSNLGLVRETRALTLPTGRVALRFADVASQIRPETVHLLSLTSADGLSVLEQNYQYDLLNPSKLLDKYVGREITLVLRSTVNNTETLTPVPATLLSNNEGQVWRINNQIVINPANIAEMRFPELPQNLVATPTLVWDLENESAGAQTVEASYLTGGMNWKADYVLVANADDKTGDLQGWVTLTNTSGVGFNDARLQLIAGKLNRVYEGNMDAVAGVASKAAPARDRTQFQEQAFFEYHLYTMERPASIREQETKQISLLESAGLTVNKEYVVDGQPGYYTDYNSPGQAVRTKVGVFIQFRNSLENKLGMALPAGTIRLYQKDNKGNQQFIGEDALDHTPKDEDVRLKVGDAFDIIAERKQTDYKVLSRSTTEYAYEITIRNHKDVPISVIVNEPIGGQWQMVQSNFPAEKTASDAARFRVPVEKDGETKLSYRVRVKE